MGVKIPSRIARATRLTHGQEVTVTLEKGRIVVEPIPHVLTLERLLGGVTAENSGSGAGLAPGGRGGRGAGLAGLADGSPPGSASSLAPGHR